MHILYTKGELQKETFMTLWIINTCDDYIAWRVKTNSAGRYMVNPKQGIIDPNNEGRCMIVLSKLKQLPDITKIDKFLIQATKIKSNTMPRDLPKIVMIIICLYIFICVHERNAVLPKNNLFIFSGKNVIQNTIKSMDNILINQL